MFWIVVPSPTQSQSGRLKSEERRILRGAEFKFDLARSINKGAGSRRIHCGVGVSGVGVRVWVRVQFLTAPADAYPSNPFGTYFTCTRGFSPCSRNDTIPHGPARTAHPAWPQSPGRIHPACLHSRIVCSVSTASAIIFSAALSRPYFSHQSVKGREGRLSVEG